MSDTYKQVEEEPIDYFINSDWKEAIEVEFKEVLKDYIDSKQIHGAIDKLSRIVSENIIQKYNGLIGQN